MEQPEQYEMCGRALPDGLLKFLLHSNRQLAVNRHVMCVVKKAGFEPMTLGTRAERATNCATAPVDGLLYPIPPFMYILSLTESKPIMGDSMWYQWTAETHGHQRYCIPVEMQRVEQFRREEVTTAIQFWPSRRAMSSHLN
jgi:hypothetical protein